jgi:translation initiation factor 2D
MLPFLPIFTAEDANDLQIKKTSWKNIKKFVKFAEKERLLKSKDRNGGETVIIDIQFESPAFINFVPYRLPPKKGQATGHTIGDN